MKDHTDTTGAARVLLAQLPTPLERLDRLSAHLGAEIWMKRDDLTGFAGGGNKVRKLEYLMAEAKAAGADTVVTAGALQSNHARQTAAAATRLGMRAVLVLTEAVAGRTAAYDRGGNLALDRLLGAEIRRLPAGSDGAAAFAETVAELEARGARVYPIPVGGSNLTGALGYARAAAEIEEQAAAIGLAPARIVTGSGSAGTQAGLVLGTAIPVLGISVASSAAELAAKVGALVAEGARSLPAFAGAAGREILVDDRFVGPGYGQPTEAMRAALQTVAELEAIFLDPVYSGKAMAGLIALAQEGRLEGPSVFLHTGGMPAIFAYDDVI
ncbi:D-cysteine desulfhydrase family protein [Frigidibacter sp. MR17.24]|uniref:D-cysteine desulfhydrase family protein n=1 Tax=Frigidibacter sp. MR17.24 TaxID=3127345 RepID=UPI003012A126